MKRFLHFSFLIPALLFTIHQILQKILSVHILVADFYLDPFCFGALVPALYAFERKLFFNQSKLTSLDLLILSILLITVSELLLPILSSRFIFDLIDAFLIIAGVFWYRVFSDFDLIRKKFTEK